MFNILYKFVNFLTQVDATCSIDSDCDTKNCFYCSSYGTCSLYHKDYCNKHECGIGDGDCDPGECLPGTTCGQGNFLDFHPNLNNCAKSKAKVCVSKGKKIRA